MEHAHVVDGARFLTPGQFAREQGQRMVSTRGRLVIASCRSGSALASRVVQRYQGLMQQADDSAEVMYLADIDYGFTDSETGVRLAVLSVPAGAAQETADRLAAAGIEGILDFAKAGIEVPPNVQLHYVDITANLEQLSFKVVSHS